MKYFYLSIGLLVLTMAGSYGQTVVIRSPSIIAPPAPGGPTIPINLVSSGNSVEYLAEFEITLKDVTIYPVPPNTLNHFWVTTSPTSGSTYFLAAIAPPLGYAELKKELDGSYCGTNGGTLYFKYEEKYNTGPLTYQVYNYQRTPMIVTNPPVLNRTLGANFFSLNIATAGAFVGTNETDSYYILEVTNDKGDKYLLRFKYLTSANY